MTETTVEVLRGLDVGFTLRGQVYVKVRLAERYPKSGGLTLRRLGEDLVVHPQKILDALLSNQAQLRAANSSAFEALFERHHRLPELRREHPPSLDRRHKRDHLRHLATGAGAFKMHGSKRLVDGEPVYYGWTLPEDATLAVPLSRGMVDVLERSKRWTAIAARVEAFEAKLDQLADAVIELREALSKLCAVGKNGLHELGMLVGLSQYCDLLLDQEGNPEPGESPLADFQEFLQRSAIPLFNEQIVCNPVDIAPRAAARRDRAARRILEILEDPAFVAGVKLVVENHDVVSHALLDNMYYYMTAAADLLSVTDEAEQFAKEHALPMMRGLAELPAEEYEATIELFDSGLREAMAGKWREALPDRETAFKLAIGIGTGVIGSVSNLEGPRSIGVAVMMQYQVHLFRRGLKDLEFSVVAFERALTMFLKHFGDFKGHNLQMFRTKVAEAVRSGGKVNLSAIAKESELDVTRGPFRGRTSRSIMALLAVGIFALTIASNPDSSWGSIFSVASAAGTMGVATLDWGPIASALEKRWKSKITIASGAMAGLVSAFGLVASGIATIDAYEKGDDLGIIEGALSTLGSAASLAGWVLSFKMGALAFAPSLMMTAGSVLLIAGLGISIWRVFAPKEPVDVVNLSLEFFQEPDSRASIVGLAPTVDTLITMASSTDFSPLDPSYEGALRALGYDHGTAAVLTGRA